MFEIEVGARAKRRTEVEQGCSPRRLGKLVIVANVKTGLSGAPDGVADAVVLVFFNVVVLVFFNVVVSEQRDVFILVVVILVLTLDDVLEPLDLGCVLELKCQRFSSTVATRQCITREGLTSVLRANDRRLWISCQDITRQDEIQ